MVKMSHFDLKISPGFIALMSLLIFVPHARASGEEPEDAFYSVQIASCKSSGEAKALIDSLKPKNLELFCKSVNFLKRGKWYRVLTGRYKTKQEALYAGNSLKQRGIIKNFVLRKVKCSSIHSKNIDLTSQKLNPLNVDKKDKAVKIEPSSGEANSSDSIKKTVSCKKLLMSSQRALQVPNKQTSLYDVAMKDFNSGSYKEALAILEQIVQHKDFKGLKKESISRLIADSYYFLGRRSNKRYLLEAIDKYRELIRDYPDLKREDATIITYRLAKSYEYLNFYPEALTEFRYLCLNYPTSRYISESLFMIGKLYYKIGEFNKAIEKFKEYIEKFPDDKHIKDAYFDVGDCYFQLGQFSDANIWYSNALEKWPDLQKISKDNLFDLGSFYLQSGRYDQALKAFFTLIVLFPEEKYSKDVIYNIARSLIGVHQPSLASKMLGLVISKYPRTREAQKSALIMADIGIINSKTKVPTYISSGMESYQEMIEIYDKMIAQIPDNEKREELLFLKGYAFLQRGSYKKSFNIYHYLLSHFFYERYKKASEKNMISNSLKYLVDNYYSKQDYFAIYNLYCKSYEYNLFKYADFSLLLKIGDSFKKLGLENYAIKHFRRMATIFKSNRERYEILFNIAESSYDKGDYNNAEKQLKDLLKKNSTCNKNTLIKVKELLGNIYYKEGSFEEAAHFYSEILESSKDLKNVTDIYAHYADSLMEMNLYPSASINYEKVIDICKDKHQKCPISLIIHSYERLGNCLYKEGRYKRAISMYKNSLDMSPKGKENPWTVFNIGQAYIKLDDNSMAEKTFAILREKTKDNFWPDLVTYYMYDKIWSKKYSKYLADSI